MKADQSFPVVSMKAHISLNVSDIAKSIAFYRAMLGIEPSKTRSDYAKFDVRNPPLNLTLNEVGVDAKGALSHLGIQLASTEDVITVREQWKEAGLDPRDEMQVNCCYAVQDKTWVLDPDGNEWEAFVVLEDDLAETSMCCVTGSDEIGTAEQRAAVVKATETAAETARCEPGGDCC